MNKFILFFIIILLNGCSKHVTKEKEEQQIPIYHHTVDLGNNYIGKAGPIIALDQKVIGIDFLFDTCLYCFDTKSKQFFRFGIKGQGGGEHLFPYTLQRIHKNEIGMYDMMDKTFNTYTISDTATFRNKYPIYKDNPSFDVKRISENRFLALGPYEKNMFVIADSLGEGIQSFYEYPYKDKEERGTKNRLRSMAYQGTISLNLSNNRFVYTTGNGDIIHIYKIENDSIKVIYKHEQSYPRYFVEEEGNGFGAIFKSDNLETYLSSAVTNRYIYLLYSGIEIGDFIKKKQDVCGNILYVYNWEGEKVTTFKLDTDCKQIAVSPDDTILWAIADNPDTMLIYFNIPSL